MGLTENDQKKIFRMYGRLEEDGDKTSVHGIGLGLTVSNHIVKLLNGDGSETAGINCFSEAEKGSVFSFSIINRLIYLRKEIQEEDVSSFLDQFEDLEIGTKLTPYTQRKPEPSYLTRELSRGASYLLMPPSDLEEHFVGGSTRATTNLLSGTNIMSSHTGTPLMSSQRKYQKSLTVACSPSKSKESFGWVLIVDDNPLNLLIAKKLVEDTGCQTVTAVHGQDAIKKAKEHHQEGKEFFKLILMDCQMPVMDGYDATKALRERMASGEIPNCSIVALTANDSEEDIKKCRESGMDDVLSKPLKRDCLKKMLEYLKI